MLCVMLSVASRKEPIAKTVDRLLCKADDITEDAQTEIGVLQRMIQDILKIRCSPMVSREERMPLEKKLRAR